MTQSGSLNVNASAAISYAQPERLRPRLWIGVALVILQWLAIKLPAVLWPQTMRHFMGMMWGPIAGAVLVLIWWLGLSRTPWRIRLIGLIGFLGGAVMAFVIGHPSIRMGLIVAALPLATTIFVASVVVGSFFSVRTFAMGTVIAPLLVWGYFSLLRMDGLDGSVNASNSWRWTATKEDRYLQTLASDPSQVGRKKSVDKRTIAAAPLSLSAGDWPGFRGADRDGRLVGATINADWAQHPPKLAWKHLIGPGWSSFCVVGDHVFTQEQRGQMEVVSCYDLATGDEIWAYEDATRFAEAIAGPGPRATPTFAEGKLYALGASGHLTCLNPATGAKIWMRDVAADSGAQTPIWGFSASPLVTGGLVSVITGGKGKSVMAYDAVTGAPAWSAGDGWSYASTQLSRIDGVDQVLFVSQFGLTSFDPNKGQLLWQHDFPLAGGANRVTQPILISDRELVLGAAFGIGTRRVKITHDDGAWKTQEIWTSRSLKPYYNDMVFHKSNLYGFDGSVFVCIDPETGKSRWRAHGYGNGQVLLIADQGLLLILSEQGEAALVDARPEEYHEIAKFHAISGKTWNHPVIAHGKLLVRNGEEVACYEVK